MQNIELSDLPSSKYPKRISVALSEENYKTLMALKAKRKDTAKFIRDAINGALSAVKLAG